MWLFKTDMKTINILMMAQSAVTVFTWLNAVPYIIDITMDLKVMGINIIFEWLYLDSHHSDFSH